MKKIPRTIVECLCGCDETFEDRDKYGNLKQYVKGHHLRGAIGHSLNSGDLNCWITYSIAECHGYIHGYIYKWTQLWNKDHHSHPTNEDKELER